ncbi:MAG: acetyl-CoA carboxylase carboxyltransferase subunit alpha/beta, partial [Gemmatimonadetes bacterium]|nr:acetyl-CoA carboxylase carboxyltransferase subunit alpha/beta [Gemmatimonadota bacterium]
MSEITPLFPEQEPLLADDSLQVIDLEDVRQSCLVCGGKVRDSELYRRLRVCPHCRFHHSLPARLRVAAIADPGTFKETNRWIKSLDPLSFSPRVSYRVRLLKDQARTGLTEAAVTGTCTIGGTAAVIIVLDFGFLGGSMGLVVGEKVALALELAARKRQPAVAMVTSGGARIQEGVLSLMQMAKTVIGVNALHERGLPLISVLGNPATGQVLASFGSMADIIFAEPGAHIGFAPFRAVQRAGDRYTSEQQYRHGLVDLVVDRERLKHELANALDLLSPYFKLEAARRVSPPRPRLRPLQPWQMVQLSRHPERPRARDYIGEVFGNFVELHGDRVFGDDATVIIGIGRLAGESVVVIAQQKSRRAAPTSGNGGDGRAEPGVEVLGETRPEGFRKARRAVEMAGRFNLPIITL